jgi:hypothetical protein
MIEKGVDTKYFGFALLGDRNLMKCNKNVHNFRCAAFKAWEGG